MLDSGMNEVKTMPFDWVKRKYPTELMGFGYVHCKDENGWDNESLWSWADNLFICHRQCMVHTQKIARMDCGKLSSKATVNYENEKENTHVKSIVEAIHVEWEGRNG